MTINETEEYLSEYQKSKKWIIHEKEVIEEMRLNLLPSGMSYDNTKVMQSVNDRTAEKMAIILEKEKRLRREIVKAKRLKQQIVEAITKAIPDNKHDFRKVLMLRYIKGDTISEIAGALGITDRHVFRIKKSAIQLLIERDFLQKGGMETN